MDTLKDYQTWARAFWLSDESDHALCIAALGLAGETGETIEHIKKFMAKGKINMDDVEEELGDVLYYWVTLCDNLGLDAQTVASRNIAKLEQRALDRGWKLKR